MPLFKKKKWNIASGLVTVNIVVALISTFFTAVLTILTLLKRLD